MLAGRAAPPVPADVDILTISPNNKLTLTLTLTLTPNPNNYHPNRISANSNPSRRAERYLPSR